MKRLTPWGVLFSCVLSTQPAYAYEFLLSDNGQPLVWTSTVVNYFVDSEIPEITRANIRASFDTWNQVIEPSLRLQYLGFHSQEGRDGTSATHLLTAWDEMYGDENRTVAHTRIVYDVQTGTITEADILLNGASFRFVDFQLNGEAGAFDAKSVILHEVGHFLGLAHSCGEAGRQYPSCFNVDQPKILEAVMAPTLSPGTERKTLGVDDLEGLDERFSILRTSKPPLVVSTALECPGPNVVLTLQDSKEMLEVLLRYEDGTVTKPRVDASQDQRLFLDALAFPSDQTVDVLVRDVMTGAYFGAYAYRPDPGSINCDANMNVEKGNQPVMPRRQCGCESSGTEIPFSWLSLFLLFAPMAVRRFGSACLVLVVVSAGLFVPRTSHAYRCTRVEINVGPSLIWTSRQVDWVLSEDLTTDFTDPSEVVDIVTRSFEAWEQPDCTDLQLNYGGQKPDLRANFVEAGPNENAVVFVSTGWFHDPGVVALTSNAFDRGSGVILDADIEVNDEFFNWVDARTSTCTSGMDLENALTHEVGHFIGLSHPPNTVQYKDTTMFAVANTCESHKRSLAQDDVDGLCAIYPKGEPTKQCHPPEGPSFIEAEKDLGYGCQAFGTNENAVIAALFLLIAIRRFSPKT